MSGIAFHLSPPFSALIFDCDGTLVDSNELHYRALNAVVGSRGVEMPRAWFFARIGFSQHEILHQFQREFRITLDPIQAAERFIGAYRQGLGALREIEAVADIARHYRGKVPMAVASDGARDIVEATLRAVRLLDLFDAVVTIAEVAGRGKPAPDLFLRAALRLRVSPAAGTVFEDSNEGIEAACRAGMTAIDVRLICRFA
jgi:HAD superfamily hydrolase (TIGR01509 family)